MKTTRSCIFLFSLTLTITLTRTLRVSYTWRTDPNYNFHPKDRLSIGPGAETSQAGVEGRSGVSTPPWARQSTPPTWNVSVKPSGRYREI